MTDRLVMCGREGLDLSRPRPTETEAHPVIVWLWQASGPGTFRGITGDDGTARRAAAQCITSGKAQTATVEAASFMIGMSSLTDCYIKTGTGWIARRSGGRVRWAALTDAGQAAS